MIVYLSVQQVLALHALQIRRFGGAKGLRDRGLLEAAVARPQATFGGEDLYPDVHSKAGALAHLLVQNHPFVDGNKRVGAHALILFLVANGFEPEFSPRELVEMTLGLASGALGPEAASVWLRQRSRAR